MKKLQGNLLLLLAAFIWGTAFVAQSVGLQTVGPFSFNCVRMLIGSLALLPVIFFLRRKRAQQGFSRRTLWLAGLACGTFLFLASSLQQVGLLYTTPGKSGFITAMYVVLVPIFGIFLKKRPSLTVLFSVALAAVGMYFLCITESFTMELGDLLTLVCACFFAGHILVIDRFSDRVDGVCLSAVQFFVCGLLSLLPALFLDPLLFSRPPQLSQLLGAWLPLLYTGVLSCGCAYTFQILGQKHTEPAVASILMCLESVFAVLGAMVILSQVPTPNEIAGCVLIFIAIVLAQYQPSHKHAR